jgi:hypothetical protein
VRSKPFFGQVIFGSGKSDFWQGEICLDNDQDVWIIKPDQKVHPGITEAVVPLGMAITWASCEKPKIGVVK